VRVALFELQAHARIVAGIHRQCGQHALVVQGCGTTPALIALAVERAMDGDTVEPGEEVAAALEAVEVLAGADEGVLGDVVGLGAAACHVQREGEDAWAIAADQVVEGAAITQARTLDELRDLVVPAQPFPTLVTHVDRPSEPYGVFGLGTNRTNDGSLRAHGPHADVGYIVLHQRQGGTLGLIGPALSVR
jgi:hypothetical protein